MHSRQSRELKRFHPSPIFTRARAIAIPSTPKSETSTAPRGAPGGADHFFTPPIAPHAVARRRDRPSNASNIAHKIFPMRTTAQTHRASRIDIETRRWPPLSRIRESLASSSPRILRPVVPSFPRAIPPAGAPRESRAQRKAQSRTHLLLDGAGPRGRALRSVSSSGRTHRPVDTGGPVPVDLYPRVSF